MINLESCLNAYSVDLSTLFIVNKVAFDRRRGYTTSYDNQTFWDFAANLDRHLQTIKNELTGKRYKFSPCLKIKRRLKPNKERDIYISMWSDKIVERWLNDSLNRLLHSWFSPSSFAYRTDKFGLDNCQFKITKTLTKNPFIIKRDIRNYFYAIDQDMLLDKLRKLVDENDFLFELLSNRVKTEFVYKEEPGKMEVGIPFGTSIACTFANIFLTDLDKKMEKLPVNYFRYADDILVTSCFPQDAEHASNILESEIKALNLEFKESHSQNFSFDDYPNFEKTASFKYLGLTFKFDGEVRFSVEKQRKIINFFKRSLKTKAPKLRKLKNLDEKLEMAVKCINEVFDDRLRSAAIVDYYLKHVSEENQLRMMDRLIAEMVISAVLNKKFKKKDFQKIPYKKLRDFGLPSLLHRNRLHRHGHLKVQFLSLYNKLKVKRYEESIKRKNDIMNRMKIRNKLKKEEKQKAEYQKTHLHEIKDMGKSIGGLKNADNQS